MYFICYKWPGFYLFCEIIYFKNLRIASFWNGFGFLRAISIWRPFLSSKVHRISFTSVRSMFLLFKLLKFAWKLYGAAVRWEGCLGQFHIDTRRAMDTRSTPSIKSTSTPNQAAAPASFSLIQILVKIIFLKEVYENR